MKYTTDEIDGDKVATALLVRQLDRLFMRSTFVYMGIENGEHCAYSYTYHEHKTSDSPQRLACECYEYHSLKENGHA